ncbi:MAG: hypothetical protein ACJARV_000003 [Candidatus Pseudothioglobus sp.]|jgi:hypothetical protein|tara:strand:+ start:662 stop:787 length:126 start_codon:yes stop_codon:yes gene_type:complete
MQPKINILISAWIDGKILVFSLQSPLHKENSSKVIRELRIK